MNNKSSTTGDFNEDIDTSLPECPVENYQYQDAESQALFEKFKDLLNEIPVATGLTNQEENKNLLTKIECIYDCDRDEYRLEIRAGIRIGKKDILLKEKKELSKAMIRRLEKLRKHLNEYIKNKKTLIDLLK